MNFFTGSESLPYEISHHWEDKKNETIKKRHKTLKVCPLIALISPFLYAKDYCLDSSTLLFRCWTKASRIET